MKTLMLLLAAAGPLAAEPAAVCADTAAAAQGHRYLVLVELAGGNDGLNTVVPFGDPAYRSARPTLAVPAADVVKLDDRFGLHPALAPLQPLWNEGEMAVLLGLGYSGQNRSHFRSMDIWETASDPNQVLTQGWITRAIALGTLAGQNSLADGIVLGETRAGPLQGSARALTLKTVDQFLKQSASVAPAGSDPTAGSPEVDLWAASKALIRDARAYFQTHPGVATATAYPKTPIGDQFATAADLIRRGVPVPVLKLTLRGFDTHGDQAQDQARLLGELADAVVAFEHDLGPLWTRTLVATYSEFGRRLAENGSGGTDHGSASVAFLWGGLVRGGLYGTAPDLSHPVNGDPGNTEDFRRLWATAVSFLRPDWSADEVATHDQAFLQRPYLPFDLLRSP